MSSESNNLKKKLLLAGSHAGSTAIAVIDEIKRRNLDWEIHWVGMEYKNLSEHVIFHNLESGKIENKFTKNTISSFLKIPNSFLKGRKIVNEIKPNLTLSFGSSAGAIVSFWSSFINVPVILHEQTASAGRANIISSYFAKKILISRESSSIFFNKNKTLLVGNPINKEILKYINDKKNTRVKSILITGGSQGSKWINDAIKPILSKLLERYYVIHQTGVKNLQEFESIKNEKYFAFGQTDPKNMAEIFSKSDIVISRSGANTCWEILALKKPSILIPIPWTYNDEATENAKYLEKLGLSRIIPQKDLSAHRLYSEIELLIEEYPAIIKKTEGIISPDLLASEKIVDILQEQL